MKSIIKYQSGNWYCLTTDTGRGRDHQSCHYLRSSNSNLVQMTLFLVGHQNLWLNANELSHRRTAGPREQKLIFGIWSILNQQEILDTFDIKIFIFYAAPHDIEIIHVHLVVIVIGIDKTWISDWITLNQNYQIINHNMQRNLLTHIVQFLCHFSRQQHPILQ